MYSCFLDMFYPFHLEARGRSGGKQEGAAGGVQGRRLSRHTRATSVVKTLVRPWVDLPSLEVSESHRRFILPREVASQPEGSGLAMVTFQDTGFAIPASFKQLQAQLLAGGVYEAV